MPSFPSIQTIDLAQVNSEEQLHAYLKTSLQFPDSYAANFDVLRDLLTAGHLASHLIFFHFLAFQQRDPVAAGKLARLRREFNRISKKEKMLFDRLTEACGPRNLFGTPPPNYGFRGDRPLWLELEETFQNYPWRSPEQVWEEVRAEIERIMGSSLADADRGYVEQFATGGMSSGMISTSFWLQEALPLLMGRFLYFQAKGKAMD